VFVVGGGVSEQSGSSAVRAGIGDELELANLEHDWEIVVKVKRKRVRLTDYSAYMHFT
jgi:hypothetical protein